MGLFACLGFCVLLPFRGLSDHICDFHLTFPRILFADVWTKVAAGEFATVFLHVEEIKMLPAALVGALEGFLLGALHSNILLF
jgi:hypothetical protein